jgi:hypothetical protein
VQFRERPELLSQDERQTSRFFGAAFREEGTWACRKSTKNGAISRRCDAGSGIASSPAKLRKL